MAGEISAQPNYGDKVKLEGFKKAGGNSGPMIQKNPVGRPAGSTTGMEVPVTPVVNRAQAEGGVPDSHAALMQDYARAMRANDQWSKLAQAADAGPWVQAYAAKARTQLEQAAVALKQQTPDFLG
jgi:hypothetical protein